MKVKLSRLDITADNEYDVQDDKTYKWLKTKTSELHEKEYSRQFYGHPDYEEVKDSILLPALPIGAYLMEVTADNPCDASPTTLLCERPGCDDTAAAR